jgi:hypothetical protein
MKDVNNIRKGIVSRSFALIGVAVLVLTGSLMAVSQTQRQFATPEDAVAALKSAVAEKGDTGLLAIFGPQINELGSGDPVADRNHFGEFADKLAKGAKFSKVTDDKMTLLIGDDEWPFAAPVVRADGKWHFDTAAGAEEMISRRIGANEIDAYYVCQAYALAQFEYFNNGDWDGDQVSEYAQKIASSPGKKDGLFWVKDSDDEDDSPLGDLFAYATKEGYKARSGTTQSAAPFHGYNFKVVFAQGASAPGGKFSYIINGNMIAGFALVAYPVNWGNSGVMTFVVNQEGRVYQKNLGPRTGAIAAAMTEYDPDVTWTLANMD